MKVVVVYESLWGNTAAVGNAIAAGLGAGARALATDEAGDAEIAQADLIVGGAPVFGFSLPTEAMRESIRTNPGSPTPPDLSHPSLRSWLEALPEGSARYAAFETRVRGPFPGGSVKHIAKGFEARGYTAISKANPFYVSGKFGPLAPGELDRARAWGEELARALS